MTVFHFPFLMLQFPKQILVLKYFPINLDCFVVNQLSKSLNVHFDDSERIFCNIFALAWFIILYVFNYIRVNDTVCK